MQVDSELLPEIEYEPPHFNKEGRLICYFGWNDDTTKAFLSKVFTTLDLRGGEKQEFSIPELGAKAHELKALSLHCNGVLEGLEQFSNIESLNVGSWPKNGLDLTMFGKLKSLYIDAEKKVDRQIPRLPSLESIGITGYSEQDCSAFAGLKYLRSLSFSQGRLRTLQGLESCPSLSSLEFAYIRNLEDVETIHGLGTLENIWLENLPKVAGNLSLQNYPGLKSFYASKVDLVVDVSGLRNLGSMQKLWLNVPSEGLEWEDIFMLPKIRLVWIRTKEGIPSDEKFHLYAERHGKTVKEIERIGIRKPKGVKLDFRSRNRAPG